VDGSCHLIQFQLPEMRCDLLHPPVCPHINLVVSCQRCFVYTAVHGHWLSFAALTDLMAWATNPNTSVRVPRSFTWGSITSRGLCTTMSRKGPSAGTKQVGVAATLWLGLLGCDAVYYCGSIPVWSEDRGSMDLWNVGILPQHYTASQPRRPRFETWPPWKPQDSPYDLR
jgi:hypothetical protein